MKSIRGVLVLYLVGCFLLALGVPSTIDLSGDGEVIIALKYAYNFAVVSISAVSVLALVLYFRRKG